MACPPGKTYDDDDSPESELNFIERIWALTKQIIRANCDFTWKGLQAKVPATLDLMAPDLADVVKRYARTAQRYIDAYHHKELSLRKCPRL